MSAAATNRVTRPAQYPSQELRGSTVNNAIPVAAVEGWRREAYHTVCSFQQLAPNWDGQGGPAPDRLVRQLAIDLLREVPSDMLPPPRIVPVSGGAIQIEWSVGNRDLEISVEPDQTVQVLRVENGIPLPDPDAPQELLALFAWVAAL